MEFMPEVSFSTATVKERDMKAQDPNIRVASQNTEGKHEQSSNALRRSII